MHITKKQIFTILLPAVILVAAVAVTAGIFIHKANQYVPLTEQQRQIMLANFEQPDFSAEAAPLKREISPEKPVNLITYYEGPENIEPLWNTLPENIREISILLLIPGNPLRPEGSIDTLLETAKACERLKIPFAIQNINGETHAEWQLPVSYLEQELCSYEYLYGFSSAEIYNGETWRGQLDGDMSQYINDCIRLCAKYGIFWLWTDTNIFGTYGTIVDWIEENEQLYDTMKANYKNIIMQNKESYGDPSSYALMEGLYLAKLIGGWGVATDWWHWQVSEQRSLFGQYDDAIDDEWERIFNYPEVMQTQSLAMVMSAGGFCFKNEAEFYSVAALGERTATFQYCTIPFFDKILDGTFQIPTREEVLAELKFAVIGGKNYDAFNYNLEESTLYPNIAEYGIVPLLPGNLRADERQIFTDAGVNLLDQTPTKELCSPYLDGSALGDTFLTNTMDQWYYINNVENKDINKTASIQKFRQNGAQSLQIESGPHTFSMIKESSDSLLITLNNFRLNKKEMIETMKGTQTPKDIINDWLCVNEAGQVKKADASQLRETVLQLNVPAGFTPQLTWLTDTTGGAYAQPFTYTSELVNGVLTLRIQHNGFVALQVTTPNGSDQLRPIQKTAVNNQLPPNTRLDLGPSQALLEEYRTAAAQTDYTATSRHLFVKAYTRLQTLTRERTCTQLELDQAAAQLKEASLLALSIKDQAAVLKQAYADDITKGSKSKAKAFDTALRTLLSPTVYYQGKDSTLEIEKKAQKSNHDATLKAEKETEIAAAFEKLAKLA